LEQIGPTSFEPSWFWQKKLPGETWVSAFFPLEVRESWLSSLTLKEVASSCFSKATCLRKLSEDYTLFVQLFMNKENQIENLQKELNPIPLGVKVF